MGAPSSEFPAQIEFRFRLCGPEESPDATVVVESESIYFLDHCGECEQTAVLFRRILDEALSFSDSSDSIMITGL